MADEKDKKKKSDAAAKAAGLAKKKAKAEAAAAAQADEGGADEAPSQPAPPPRLIAHYREKVIPALQQRFGYKNLLAVPRMEKIVISMGVGKFATGGEKEKINQAEK